MEYHTKVRTSNIPFFKIISVLVSIKFELNHDFSISFYTVSELFSVLVSIKFFLQIISVQFQYLHHSSNSYVIDNTQTVICILAQ